MTSARHLSLDTTAVLLVVGCCFLWGLNQVAAKAALVDIPPLWQAAARSVGGALLVAIWARWRGVPLGVRDGTAHGGLLFGLEFVCIFVGLQHTTASRRVVFLYISPFVIALGMPFISRAERLSAVQTGGLVLAFAGVAWAYAEGFGRPAAGPRQWLGDALGLAAGVIWGATTLAVRGSALATAPAEKMLLWQLVVSGALLTALALLGDAPLPTHVSALAGGSLAFQVVVVVSMSYLVWFWLIRTYPATQLASFTLLTPMFGLLLGAWLLHEPITARLIVAAVTVGLGLVLVNRRR